MKIKVGLSRNSTPLSKLIRLFTNSQVSHCFILINDETVLHAGFPYVMGWYYQNFLKHNVVVATFEVEVPEWRVKWAYAQAGKTYGWVTLFGMLFVLLGKRLKINIKNPFPDNEGTYICSEFAARVIGYPNSEDISPQDLLEYLESNYGQPKT